MLAAAVGTAPGTARTKKKCPGIVQVIKMGVISGLESQNGRPSAPRASIVVPADGQPWRIGDAQLVNYGMSLSAAALTLAGACQHMSEGP